MLEGLFLVDDLSCKYVMLFFIIYIGLNYVWEKYFDFFYLKSFVFLLEIVDFVMKDFDFGWRF